MKDVSKIVKEMRRAVDSAAVVSYSDPFKVLVSTVLSQRTRDANTAAAAKKLFAKYDTAEAMAKADAAEISRRIKPSGFFRVKARKIKELSRQIVEDFGGTVPARLEDLLRLPGVGRKTANCVLVYGFGIPAIPVDTHVHRLSNRIGLVKAKEPEQTEAQLMAIVPKKHWTEFNHLMVKYGQKVCLPVKPRCWQCALERECDYFGKKQGEKVYP